MEIYSEKNKETILKNPSKYNMNKALLCMQFTEDELKTFINHVEMKRVLISQKNLSKKFIDDYILNPDNHFTDADMHLNIHHVIRYQPHLKSEYIK
jgi:hypothetical protein